MGTDSIMRLVAVSILLAAACFVPLAGSQKSEISAKGLEISPAPVKLDKNLRQALLKALTDLEAESAEQRKDEDEKSLIMRVEKIFDEGLKKNSNNNIGVIPKSSFTFDGFPGDEDIPNEEKLQNSSFLESKKYVASSPAMSIEKASHDDARSFHVHNIVVPDKPAPRTESKVDSLDTRSVKTLSSSASVNKIESVTLKPITQISESLTQSASSGIANANALITPKPTASSPTIPPPKNNATSLSSGKEKNSPVEEVKIFEAPLVAAFTVQQDELGVPKSVVPIYKQSGDGQALTLQEQLEFKQRLLEKQLAELQQQQIVQTHFLLRQRELYEQQLREKQQQQYFQEQARLRQLAEERAKHERIRQLEEQHLRQLEEQKIYRLQQQQHQQQNYFPLQKQHIFEQTNKFLSSQSSQKPTVHLQPSLSLELPNAGAPPLFRNYQEQPHFQQFHQQPQQQSPHQQPHQQPRLQQDFPSFPIDFQPPTSPATRFNRQEAFNAVGNFGFNNLDNKQALPPPRNTFTFNALPKSAPSTFVYNPYVQFRPLPPPQRAQTPAKQIQRLLFQSGVAGDLGNVQGPGGEDLNIVSKVLALNVGALPNKNYQFVTSNRKLGSSA
ncbi:putative uncharacterized protein DDB_G0268364 [Pseudomyrmex gracilis]|uniref:putative uncharacterized protein DDB_G0268364 n=1 Tax=Pseudomyrmex gracilis TaxID=219809 RepID=UPI0009954A10|nr:putative uncharacterized protein DDB_G0268364 [Pseudomyrmex gracilis]